MNPEPPHPAALERSLSRAVATAELDTDPARHLLAAFLVGYEGHTRTAYARDLTDWLAFCNGRGINYIFVDTSVPVEEFVLSTLRKRRVLR